MGYLVGTGWFRERHRDLARKEFAIAPGYQNVVPERGTLGSHWGATTKTISWGDSGWGVEVLTMPGKGSGLILEGNSLKILEDMMTQKTPPGSFFIAWIEGKNEREGHQWRVVSVTQECRGMEKVLKEELTLTVPFPRCMRKASLLVRKAQYPICYARKHLPDSPRPVENRNLDGCPLWKAICTLVRCHLPTVRWDL